MLKSFFEKIKNPIDCGAFLSYNIVTVVESGAKWYEVVKITKALNNRKYHGEEAMEMLSGEFKHILDPKKRLFIPSKHREELGESFMVARSIRDNCLKVYSMAEWDNYIAPILKMDRKDSEVILRTLHRNAAQVAPDAQGRIVLPVSLIEHAKIVKGAVVVGCGTYAEIWSEEEYTRTVDEENFADIRAALESFGL